MKTNVRLSNLTRAFIIFLALGLATAFVPSSDAFAGGYARYAHGHGHAYGHYHHGYAPYRAVAVRSFYVPGHIYGNYVSAYRPYYGGQFYFAPHHHVHSVYTFPVYYPTGAVAYRPYVYCDGGLVASPWLPPGGNWFSVSAGVPIGNAGFVQFHGSW